MSVGWDNPTFDKKLGPFCLLLFSRGEVGPLGAPANDEEEDAVEEVGGEGMPERAKGCLDMAPVSPKARTYARPLPSQKMRDLLEMTENEPRSGVVARAGGGRADYGSRATTAHVFPPFVPFYFYCQTTPNLSTSSDARPFYTVDGSLQTVNPR